MRAIETALGAAVRYLHEHQQADGEFTTLLSSAPDIGTAAIVDSSPYATAQIVYSLRFVDTDAVSAPIAAGLAFVESQMEGNGIWRYWTTKHERQYAVVPDCDTTALCAATLVREGRPSPRSAKEIILCGHNADGSFYCWMYPRTKDQQAIWATYGATVDRRGVTYLAFAKALDAVCNVVMSNVVWFLGETPQTARTIERLVEIARTSLPGPKGPSWPDPDYFCYAVSRAYHHGVAALAPAIPALVSYATGVCRDEGANSLSRALAMSTLANVGAPYIPEAERLLLATQADDGSWPAVAWFTGPGPNGGRNEVGYYGSREITTALCVEALARAPTR